MCTVPWPSPGGTSGCHTQAETGRRESERHLREKSEPNYLENTFSGKPRDFYDDFFLLQFVLGNVFLKINVLSSPIPFYLFVMFSFFLISDFQTFQQFNFEAFSVCFLANTER
ncbi:hypothetical protein GOODEAATRI_026184 [Goodea atripinnis]|uniref:Uncharacterized protein n=1 Tax=Goodea atripinnis TaxID=208336 RepID=A0ABV0PS31_9TELE